MKHRTAFTVTLTTDDEYSARDMAKELRLMLHGHLFYSGKPGNRKSTRVTKVTVTSVGEK
jgi:hypothetical protein